MFLASSGRDLTTIHYVEAAELTVAAVAVSTPTAQAGF
jgi:hypothetical protein